MPYFNPAPNGRTILVSAGSKSYLLGSVAVTGGRFLITNVAVASNVATVTVVGWSGWPPVVGTPITIRGTTQSGGAFNVTNAPVTALNLDQSGAGTISFALTAANLGTTADAGSLTFEPIVTGETAVNNAFSQAGALARPSAVRSQNAVFVQLTLPTAGVTSLTVTMQVSEDSVNYLPTSAVLTVTAGAPTNFGYFETTALYVRAALTGLTGTGTVALVVGI